MNFDCDLTKLNIEASYKDIAKMEKKEPQVDFAAWENSFEMLYNHCIYMKGYDFAPMEDVLKVMDPETSPGFPWTKIGHNKLDVVSNPIFQKYLDELIAEVDNSDNFVPRIFYNVFLKEELRPVEKLKLNKLRDICPADLSHYLIGQTVNMYTSDKFLELHKDKYGLSVVGINPFYCGWNDLYNRISEFKNCGIGDVKQWDSSMFTLMILDDMEIHWLYLKNKTPEKRRRLVWVYYSILMACMVMPTGEVLKKFFSQTTGNHITTYLNTRGHIRIWFYIWNRIMKNNDLKMFNKIIRLALYGDDLLFTLHDNYIELFSPKNLIRFYKELGFDLEAKDSFCDPIEAVFLNRHFVKVGNLITFAMERPQKALAALYRLKNHKNPAYTIQRCQGLKVSYFMHKQVLDLIEDFEAFLINRYHRILKGDVEWDNSLKGMLSRRDISYIYFGYEAANTKPDSTIRLGQLDICQLLGKAPVRFKKDNAYTKAITSNT